jgi:glycine hydroxymethyltransferase
MEAQGSVLTNKYAEGYPGRRYYGGCEFVDRPRTLAIERVKPCSAPTMPTSSRTRARRPIRRCYLALLKPGDTILGMDLSEGGHLTHGAKVNFSGKMFNAVHYGLNRETGEIDYERMAELAAEHRPKMLIGGFSAYSRVVDWARMREIADSVGAWFLVDMAHVAGLVAAGVYPNPVPHAHVVTSTTHKTLRGPRGGIILASGEDEALTKKFNSLVFPGCQGGPLMHVIAAKAVAFKEALEPEFKAYQQQVVDNARAMADTMIERGYKIVSGGTDNHLFLVDLIDKDIHRQGCRGGPGPGQYHGQQEYGAGRTALTVRDLGPAHRHPGRDHPRLQRADCQELAGLICDVLDNMGDEGGRGPQRSEAALALCRRYPVYG